MPAPLVIIGGIAIYEGTLWAAAGATAIVGTWWYGAGGKQATEQVVNHMANSISGANSQAGSQLQSGAIADTCATGDCPQEDPECAALREQIQRTVTELTKRRGDMLADSPTGLGGLGMYDLFQMDPNATVPHPNKPGESLGNWKGHHDQIRQKQQYLRDRINKFNRRGCGSLPAGAETQEGLDPPTKPFHYQ